MNGLCDDCAHSKRIISSRDSEFILCQLSKTDPEFQKYPRLPVLSCKGFEFNSQQSKKKDD